MVAVICISPEFSLAEQERARAAAVRDPRLAVVLEATGYGLTQTLAAAPQLVARWQDARTANPYAWAVLTAALDMARLGARTPLSPDLLRAAAPGYCTSQQQAEAPDNWFEQALAYATAKLHGAAAALAPAGTGMGHVAGYTVADYLIQYASQDRHFAHVPTSTWNALLSYVRDPADAARLADSAMGRLLFWYGISLYRRAAADDAEEQAMAAFYLSDLLAARGHAEELRARADAGDAFASRRLADLLAARGDLDGLRARADAGDGAAASRLADRLAARGDLNEALHIARARARVGDVDALLRLEKQFTGRLARWDLDELRAWADAGWRDAASRLAELQAEQGDMDELRARADAGDRHAASRLADLMAKRGDLAGTMRILRAQADAGYGDVERLAALLTQQGRGEEAERLRRYGLNPDGSIANR